ncbi:HAD family hydrolase [Herbiconiux sp.]|uniref:HAD family hydrolase n=1 Tax=Herbiconiux sp. TaxID=1871186 RepID=UPI0025BDF274|nr:HAD family hydrolase [Herbiconiux sp.]
MLLLADLDNTLIDRDRAFHSWAREFAAEVTGGTGTPACEAESEAAARWLIEADASGYAPRPELAERIRTRFGLHDPVEAVLERLLSGFLPRIDFYPGVQQRLVDLKARGSALVIVTNGVVRQQSRKLAQTGLDELADACLISEAVGAKKPDPQIFAEALAAIPRRSGDAAPAPSDAWMIGDHPVADIAGARAAGLSTAWVSHDRPWTEPWLPTLTAATTAEALDLLATRP